MSVFSEIGIVAIKGLKWLMIAFSSCCLIGAIHAQSDKSASLDPVTSPLLPHLKQFVPGIYAAGFAHKHRNANCGWIAMSESNMPVDLPRGVAPEAFLSEVRRISGKAADALVLTHFQDGGAALHIPDHGVLFTGPLVVNGPRDR